MRGSSVAVLAAAACLAFAAGCSAPQLTANGRKAMAVVERTKTTRFTYALYNWNHVTIPNQPAREEWSAEFNEAARHRVEGPMDRVVADCVAGTGAHLMLASGQTDTSPAVARSACGIDTNSGFESETWVGLVDTPFGKADRVRLVTADTVRTYDIDPRGVILREVIARRDAQETRVVLTVAVGYEPALPPGELFDAASLQTSFTPDRYKQPPSGVAIN